MSCKNVSTHSRAKAADTKAYMGELAQPVSTHSRAKAAAHDLGTKIFFIDSFNTQPREGGCL